ncbi:hypothetical protein C8J57DRAFT_1284302, partial [Mycena rebaudengoi]
MLTPQQKEEEQVDALLQRSKELLQEFDIDDHPLTKFTTGDDEQPLHELDPAFRKVTLENARIKELVRDLQFHRDPVALQSMVITKQPQIGASIGEHNDSCYTSPPSALGFWIALEKCTESNGALSFLPGSHLTTPITKRFVRAPGGGTTFEPLVSSAEAERIAAETRAASGAYVLETCEPGDLVLIHGSTRFA